MNTPSVRELVRPFDPQDVGAEERYDNVVCRVNQLRFLRIEVARELAELERQFIESDLVIQSGPGCGQPLTADGRRQRLARMLELSDEFGRLNQQEQFSTRQLQGMNEALDRWARDTYGAEPPA